MEEDEMVRILETIKALEIGECLLGIVLFSPSDPLFIRLLLAFAHLVNRNTSHQRLSCKMSAVGSMNQAFKLRAMIVLVL